MNKTIAIVGASRDRSKYGNKAVRAYAKAGWTVYPVNPKGGEIEGLKCYHSLNDVPKPLERVSLYLPPEVGKELLPELTEMQHQELWLNPGSADKELVALAKELGLNPIQACSIVDIGMSPGQFPD